MTTSFRTQSTPDHDPRARHLRRVAWEESHPPEVFTGVPTFLRAGLRTAKAGAAGYREPGFHHGLHVRRLSPLRIDDGAWEEAIDNELAPLAEAGDTPGVDRWLCRHFPYVMAGVPRRRRAGYVAGFIAGLLRD